MIYNLGNESQIMRNEAYNMGNDPFNLGNDAYNIGNYTLYHVSGFLALIDLETNDPIGEEFVY